LVYIVLNWTLNLFGSDFELIETKFWIVGSLRQAYIFAPGAVAHNMCSTFFSPGANTLRAMQFFKFLVYKYFPLLKFLIHILIARLSLHSWCLFCANGMGQSSRGHKKKGPSIFKIIPLANTWDKIYFSRKQKTYHGKKSESYTRGSNEIPSKIEERKLEKKPRACQYCTGQGVLC